MFLLKAELMELDMELKNLAIAEASISKDHKILRRLTAFLNHYKSLITEGPLPLEDQVAQCYEIVSASQAACS